MARYVKVSKAGCGACSKMGIFMKTSPMKPYLGDFEEITKEDNLLEYNKYLRIAMKSGAQSLPLIVDKETEEILLVGFDPSKLMTLARKP